MSTGSTPGPGLIRSPAQQASTVKSQTIPHWFWGSLSLYLIMEKDKKYYVAWYHFEPAIDNKNKGVFTGKNEYGKYDRHRSFCKRS